MLIPGEQSNVAKIERVIIAGDSLSTSTRGKQDQVKAKYLTANAAAGSIAAVRQLDDLLVQLGKNYQIILILIQTYIQGNLLMYKVEIEDGSGFVLCFAVIVYHLL